MGERPLAIELMPPGALDELGGATIGIHHGESGYRFVVAGAGVYELSTDGRHLRCRPVPAAGWDWRRYLIGQVLPFASVLQRLEVFHASAVEIDGVAVAISGPSGLGKSALARELHLGGAGFITDDVLAVEQRNGTVIAYPGVAMSKVRRRIGAGMLEARRHVTPIREPLPLGAFCFLRASEDDELRVSEGIADPRQLLGGTYNLVVTEPARLNTQIDLCAAIGTQARMLEAALPPAIDAGVAAELRAWLTASPVAA